MAPACVRRMRAAMTSGNDWGASDANVNIDARNIVDLLEAKVRT